MNFNSQLGLFTIPSIKKETAAIIAEIGSGYKLSNFPTSQHLASRAGLSAGNMKVQGNEKRIISVRRIFVDLNKKEPSWYDTGYQICAELTPNLVNQGGLQNGF
jgi:hypothetical protein